MIPDLVPNIRLEGNWGCPSEEVGRVLRSVLERFSAHSHASEPLSKEIIVRPAIRDQKTGGWQSMSLYQKENNSPVIHLAVEGPHWHEYVYHFAHELGHQWCQMFRRFEQGENFEKNRFHWLEEAICGACKFFALDAIARSDLPYAWHCGDKFKRVRFDYGSISTELNGWLILNDSQLLRAKGLLEVNRPLAVHIHNGFPNGGFLPSTRFLYRWKTQGKSFGEHLTEWESACPSECRDFPIRLKQWFCPTVMSLMVV
jgi:hypothetical protein